MFKAKSEKHPERKPDEVLQMGDIKVKRFVLKKKQTVVEPPPEKEEQKIEQVPAVVQEQEEEKQIVEPVQVEQEEIKQSPVFEGGLQKKCANCMNFMVEPVTLKCGHRACLFCIRGVLNDDDIEAPCPMCEEGQQNAKLSHLKKVIQPREKDFKKCLDTVYQVKLKEMFPDEHGKEKMNQWIDRRVLGFEYQISFEIGNTYHKSDDGKHQWTAFFELSPGTASLAPYLAEMVSSVSFLGCETPKTFEIQPTGQNTFHFEISGASEKDFVLGVKLAFKKDYENTHEQIVWHKMNFEGSGKRKSVHIGVQKYWLDDVILKSLPKSTDPKCKDILATLPEWFKGNIKANKRPYEKAYPAECVVYGKDESE